ASSGPSSGPSTEVGRTVEDSAPPQGSSAVSDSVVGRSVAPDGPASAGARALARSVVDRVGGGTARETPSASGEGVAGAVPGHALSGHAMPGHAMPGHVLRLPSSSADRWPSPPRFLRMEAGG